MWNYYTKSKHYEGYNIGFDSNLLQGTKGFEEGYTLEINKVIYSHFDKGAIFDRFIPTLAAQYQTASEEEQEFIISGVQNFINKYQFYFKNACFMHEQEVRAILRVPIQAPDGKKVFNTMFRNVNGYIIPYIEYTCSKSAVQKITCAPLLNPDLSVENMNKLLIQRNYKNIKVKASEVPIRF